MTSPSGPMSDGHTHVIGINGPECVSCIQAWVNRCEGYRRERDHAVMLLQAFAADRVSVAQVVAWLKENGYGTS